MDRLIIIGTRSILAAGFKHCSEIMKPPKVAYKSMDLLSEWGGFSIGVLYDCGDNDSYIMGCYTRGINKREGNLRLLESKAKKPYFAGAIKGFCDHAGFDSIEQIDDYRFIHGNNLMNKLIDIIPEYVEDIVSRVRSNI